MSLPSTIALGLASLLGSDPLEVRAPTCVDLDAAEVERLVELELAAVTQEVRDGPPLQVELVCDADTLRIGVLDPLTSKQLERTVPAPAAEPGRSRVVALAVAQLFAASWLELLLAPPPDEPDPIAPPPAQGTSPAAIDAAATAARDWVRAPPVAREVELLAGAGARGRALESAPWGALHIDLDARAWLRPRVAVIGRVGFDVGRSLRAAGQVRGSSVIGSVGMAWRSGTGSVTLGGALLAGAGFASVRGDAPRPGYEASTLRGATGEALVSVGPRIAVGRLRVELDADVGAMLRTPRGLISDDVAVTMGGVFAGGTLRLGGALPRS